MLPATDHPTTLKVIQSDNPTVLNVLVDMVSRASCSALIFGDWHLYPSCGNQVVLPDVFITILVLMKCSIVMYCPVNEKIRHTYSIKFSQEYLCRLFLTLMLTSLYILNWRDL